MPTQDKTEHDFLESEQARRQLTEKEFLLGIVNERERKYEQRMDGFDKSFAESRQEIKDALAQANANTKDALAQANANTKDALAVATTNTKDALTTANGNIATALAAIDKRFESVNEFRSQLADQQETFARKGDVDTLMASFKEATLKAEAGVEKRFDAVNEFRSQLADQQATLVRKSEVDIRFEALEKKLDTAVSQLQLSKGHDSGVSSAWGVLVAIGAIVISGIAAFAGVGAFLVNTLKH